MTTRAIVRPVVRSICRPVAGALGTPLLGPELLANGGFDSDTVWTKGTGWTIAAGQAVCTTPGVTSSLSQPYAFIPGRTYQLVIVVSNMTAAALVPRGYLVGGVAFSIGSTITTAGTYTRLRVATAADTFAIDGSAAAISSIDSVSLRLVAT
ncbi:MAG: hypothetical protein KA144_02200 [Xanthomonadaceae bacterium]|nr:hypothetical protein [Xanthomonadaceae bacterium]MBP7622445.1 hypothetical protein [Xanthomonadales bacterium]